MLCLQTESFKLSQPYSQCTEDGSDVPVQNIYNAVYSLQVRAGGVGQAWAAARTQGTRLHTGRGVSGTRNSGKDSWGSSRHLSDRWRWLVPVPFSLTVTRA